jgi:hypothetical protein
MNWQSRAKRCLFAGWVWWVLAVAPAWGAVPDCAAPGAPPSSSASSASAWLGALLLVVWVVWRRWR